MTRVWIVDDELSLTAAREIIGDGHDLEVTEPAGEAFRRALYDDWDLILIDEELWENEEEPRLPPAAVDGSSLVAVIRAWARKNSRQLPSIAILTNKERVFADAVPSVGAWRPVANSFVNHEPQIGGTLDVEWLFAKRDPRLKEKIGDLADSWSRAHAGFGDGGISFAELKSFLGLNNKLTWLPLAEFGLREARPPVTEDQPGGVTPPRGAVAVVDWLLHRALAFPGLFVSDYHAAAFLGLKPEALEKAIKASGGLLDECVYRGPLSSLTSRRWWGPALNALAADLERRQLELSQLVGLTPEDLVQLEHPVVVVDQTLAEIGIVSVEDAVRINPPGWPAECMQPWMRRSEAEHSPHWVQEMIDPLDRGGGAA